MKKPPFGVPAGEVIAYTPDGTTYSTPGKSSSNLNENNGWVDRGVAHEGWEGDFGFPQKPGHDGGSY